MAGPILDMNDHGNGNVRVVMGMADFRQAEIVVVGDAMTGPEFTQLLDKLYAHGDNRRATRKPRRTPR